MKRVALVFTAVLAFVGPACSYDEGDDSNGDAAAKADASGDAAGSVACTGSFAGVTRSQLVANANGKCSKASDLDLLCTGDIGGAARACGATCLLSAGGNNATVPACVSACVKKDHAVSDDCLGCYAASVTCTLNKCLTACSTDPNSAGCLSCQTAQGCLAAFFTCSGLPAPAGVYDGGVTDAAADAKTDASADAKTDVSPDSNSDAVKADASVDRVDSAPVDAPADAPAVDASVDAAVDAAVDAVDAGAVD